MGLAFGFLNTLILLGMAGFSFYCVYKGIKALEDIAKAQKELVEVTKRK